jgi:glycosyltransferase involved in cell wall biosynthesis
MRRDQGYPMVSIVTPSLNHGAFIEETIRSVLLQGYPKLEYIVIDGGSRDNTVDILRKYEPWLSYWNSWPDNGPGHATNKGFEHATGEVFGTILADDTYRPRGILTLMELRSAKPKSIVWVGGCPEVDLDGNIVNPGLPFIRAPEAIGDWGAGAWLGCPACLFDAGSFRKAGGMEESLKTAHDVELWVKLAKMGDFALTNELVATARYNPNSVCHRDVPGVVADVIHINCAHGYRDNARAVFLRYAVQEGLRLATPTQVCQAFTADELVRAMGARPLAKALLGRLIGAFSRRVIRKLLR